MRDYRYWKELADKDRREYRWKVVRESAVFLGIIFLIFLIWGSYVYPDTGKVYHKKVYHVSERSAT